MIRKMGIAAVLSIALTGACGNDSDETTAGGGGAGGDESTGGAGTGGGDGGSGGEASCFGTVTDDPMLAAALDAIRTFMVDNNVPGGAAIAIVKDGRTLGVGTTGSKSAPACNPITEDTLMLTTTASELITTIAALDAVEEGVLSLDGSITSAVPTLNAAPSVHGTVDDITLHHLLSHTSGYRAISDQWFTFNTCTSLEDAVTNADVPLLYWPAGAMHHPFMRSNTEIAGLALQNVDGVPFEQVARARVLDPLGMGGLYDKAEIEASDPALGHFSNFQDEPVEGCANRHPSDGYYASIRDMAKLLELLTGGGAGVLEPETLGAMLSPQGVHFWTNHYSTYGFDDAWHDETTGANMLFTGSFLNGNWQGTMLFKDRGLAISLMMNSSALELKSGVVNLVPLVNELFEIADPTLAGFDWLPPYTPGPDDLASVVGTYTDPVGFNAEGERTLEVSIDPQNPMALVGVMTGWDGTVQSLNLSGYSGTDLFKVTPSAHDQLGRFWREDDGDAYAFSLGHNGGPPFYRVPTP